MSTGNLKQVRPETGSEGEYMQMQQQPQPPIYYAAQPAPMMMQPPTTSGPDVPLVSQAVYGGGRRTDFTHGLMDCTSECGTCCYACCCPCCLYGENQMRAKKLDSSSGDCCIYCLVGYCLGFPCIIQASGRERIRHKANIEGSWIEDCLLSWVCGPCGLTQEKRELDELQKANLL